jgi:PDZ domain-containing protein
MQTPDWQMPEPPGVEPVAFNPWRWIIFALIVAILVFVAFFVPIPVFYEYLPGPTPRVERLIELDGARTYSSEGGFIVTTVSVDTEVTVSDMVLTAFDDTTTIVTREQVTGGQSLNRLRRDQEREMQTSHRHAEEVAFAALGFGRPRGDGARVVETIPDSPAEGKLRPNDLIVEIDGKKVETTCEVGTLVDDKPIGDEVEVTVRRDGEVRTISLETAANPQDPKSAFVGIFMRDVNYKFKPGVDVEFSPGEIAGPSAGLMFSLFLYDQLTPEDLTDGRLVAGTGTIDCDGGIGPIGGVAQKVAGAEARGADVFISPQLNAADARAAAGDIRIVAVSTFDQALEYLEGLE